MARLRRLLGPATRVWAGFFLATAALTLAACQSPPTSTSSRERAAVIAPVAPPPEPGYAETLYFEPGSSALSHAQLVTLASLAGRMEAHSALRVHVVGYSDSSSLETADTWLSERRAKNVASYLASQGLAVGNVTLQGGGVSQDPAQNPRRAVVTVR